MKRLLALSGLLAVVVAAGCSSSGTKVGTTIPPVKASTPTSAAPVKLTTTTTAPPVTAPPTTVPAGPGPETRRACTSMLDGVDSVLAAVAPFFADASTTLTAFGDLDIDGVAAGIEQVTADGTAIQGAVAEALPSVEDCGANDPPAECRRAAGAASTLADAVQAGILAVGDAFEAAGNFDSDQMTAAADSLGAATDRIESDGAAWRSARSACLDSLG